jgi:glycosyltransferase involved in cell wall biosynthesis
MIFICSASQSRFVSYYAKGNRRMAARGGCRKWRILCRVRIVYADLETEWRGGQGQALLTVRMLQARGHEAELVAVEGGVLARRAAAEGMTVRAVGAHRRRWNAAREIRSILRERGADIVFANEPHALTAAWLARAHRRAALIVARRVAYPIGEVPLAKARYRAADRVFAISQFVAESVVRSGISAERVAVVTEGTEIPAPRTEAERSAARRAWNCSGSDFLFGCVGYLLPEKGQELLVRAMPAICAAAPHARLLLAGDGPIRASLESLSLQLGVREHIVFSGFVERVNEVYAALDAFLFPSLEEPLGTSLLAAMAWGLPVAAVARGGVPEHVVDNRTGLLVPEPRPEFIADAAVRLLGDRELRERLGSEARSAVLLRHSPDAIIDDFLRACEDVMRSRRSRLGISA